MEQKKNLTLDAVLLLQPTSPLRKGADTINAIKQVENEEDFSIDEISVDKELIDKIFKFASIKHILSNHKNDNHKVLELLEEIIRDLKNYELEFRIEELESKFSKDLSENTFNEIRELKKLQKIN